MTTQLPTNAEPVDPRAILLSITEYGIVPQQIMTWLIDVAGQLASMYNIPLLQVEDMPTIQAFYAEQFNKDKV